MSALLGGVKAHRLPSGAYAITVDGDYIGDVWSSEGWYFKVGRIHTYTAWVSEAGDDSDTRYEAVRQLMQRVGVR